MMTAAGEPVEKTDDDGDDDGGESNETEELVEVVAGLLDV
jgi:hypothetical protein